MNPLPDLAASLNLSLLDLLELIGSPHIQARLAALEQHALKFALPLGWRKPRQGHEVAALKARAGCLKHLPLLFIDQPRQGVRPVAVRVTRRSGATRFNMDAPSRSKAPQRIVETRACAHQFGRSR